MKKFFVILIVATGFLILSGFLPGRQKPGAADLGALLFSDPILSKDGSISCASCHIPAFAFADTARVSTGVFGRKGTRNSPTAMNLLLRRPLFWDGRAATLEEQALAPIENPDEMDLPLDSAIARLKQNKRYRGMFFEIYQSEPSKQNLASAIAAFEKTLETSESPFDNWKFSGDSTLVTATVRRGFELFSTKGKCTQCHFGSDFTANEFRNIGLYNGLDLNDSGRAMITGRAEDLGKFKTPSLRNIAITDPYMHNGKFRTLDEVLDFYNDPKSIVPNALFIDSNLSKPLGLSAVEKLDIKNFLLSLTDKRFSR